MVGDEISFSKASLNKNRFLFYPRDYNSYPGNIAKGSWWIHAVILIKWAPGVGIIFDTTLLGTSFANLLSVVMTIEIYFARCLNTVSQLSLDLAYTS